LIVVSGPSGVGKSSVVDGLARRHPFSFSVSMTTRAARPGEVDGVDYLFVDEPAFDRAVADGRLVEWAEYGGHMYGTPASGIEEALAEGRDVLLDIEIVGSRIIHDRHPDALMVFIAPPDLAELERRLRSRGDTSETDVAVRLAVATEQMEAALEFFDHFVVNDDLGVAIDEVGDILASVPEPSDESP
jgi:guanylate kinase